MTETEQTDRSETRTDRLETQSDRSETRTNRLETQSDRTETGTEAVAGHRAVLLIVGLSIGTVSSLGFLVGVFGPQTLDVGRIGPITFPVTPLTLAAYGLVMTGTALGVFVAGVAWTVYYVNSKDHS
jgi:hypothetical protein